MNKRTTLVAILVAAACIASAPQISNAEQEPLSVEETVREYFADIPVLVEIARCESEFRQFNHDGSVLRGGQGGGMIGIFQFYEAVHANASKALGLDLHTIEGNLAYAKHLYDALGTTPWNSAKSCWNVPTLTVTSNALSSAEREVLLAQISVLLQIVEDLQSQLAQQRSLTLH